MTTTDGLAPRRGESLTDYSKRLDTKLGRDEAKRAAARAAFEREYLAAGGDPRELEKRAADYFKGRDERLDAEARQRQRDMTRNAL